jgi:hypothetical protein
LLLGKFDGLNHVLGARYIHCILDIITKSTGLRGWLPGIAALVCEERCHNGGR